MKKFLFITHLTPKRYRSPLREELISIMQSSLLGQTYTAWQALWIGEEERLNGNIREVKVLNGNREELGRSLRETYARPDVRDMIAACNYIVKLDDDDVISADILEKVSRLEFDCYCDEYHTFYDIMSGIVTQQKRNWIASTSIHKKEHALILPGRNTPGANLIDSLFYTDHAKDWINYYAEKNLKYAERGAPVYLRVLSPTSITAGAGIRRVLAANDIDLQRYYTYRRQFGTWKSKHITGFAPYLPQLNRVWPAFSGQSLRPVSNLPLKQKIKRILGID